MNWLNYHHLLYFWTMAQEGSISRAADKLHLSQPTISGQLRQLERSVGTKLYERVGRDLRLTETGQLVYEYADDIFTTGQELMERLRGNKLNSTPTLAVGVPDFMPKYVVFRLLEPIFQMPEKVQLISYEGKLPDLLAELALHRIDLVLSDTLVTPDVSIRAYHHRLGESPVSWVAPQELADELRPDYPTSLAGQPLLIPTPNTVFRRSIEQWLDGQTFEPEIGAEVEDSALLKILAMQGLGIAPVPDTILRDVREKYGLFPVGQLDGVIMQFYAISVERKVTHPAVKAITDRHMSISPED